MASLLRWWPYSACEGLPEHESNKVRVGARLRAPRHVGAQVRLKAPRHVGAQVRLKAPRLLSAHSETAQNLASRASRPLTGSESATVSESTAAPGARLTGCHEDVSKL